MTRRLIPALLFAVVGIAAGTSQMEYWEAPDRKAPAADAGPLPVVSYSTSAASDRLLALTWQERTGTGNASRLSIYLDTARLDAIGSDTRWSGRHSVYEAIPLPGVSEVPRVHALAVDGDRILVAIVVPGSGGPEGSEIVVRASSDEGRSFSTLARFRTDGVVTSPELSRTSTGGWLLTLTRPEAAVAIEGAKADTWLSIAYTVSVDGASWDDVKPLLNSGETGLRQNIQPHHVVADGADYIVFQSTPKSTHIYLKRSSDGGRTWGDAIPITSTEAFAESVDGTTRQPDDFINQRPYLAASAQGLALAWERAGTQGNRALSYAIYYCELDLAGVLVRAPENVSLTGSAMYPEIVAFGGDTGILYAQQSPERKLLFAQRGTRWASREVAPAFKADLLISHAASYGGRVYSFAEAGTRATLLHGETWTLWVIRPDTSATAPMLAAQDFTPGTPQNRTAATVAWNEPADASGIAGYRYAWGLDGTEAPTRELSASIRRLSLPAPTDGTWNLRVWSVDQAGNVSRVPSSTRLVRDTTPPGRVSLFLLPASDADGNQPSNDFSISWSTPEGDPVRYEVSAPVKHGGGSLTVKGQSIVAENADDGTYTISVAAVDQAGNVSEAALITLHLDKYLPKTLISGVRQRTDQQQNLLLDITGLGFQVGGKILEVYLDRDGKAPYDITLDRTRFTVENDARITTSPLGADYDSGEYRVGVRHPVRPVVFWRGTIGFTAPGEIKLGDFSFRWAPRWVVSRAARLYLPFTLLLVILCAGLLTVLLVASTRRAVAVAREGAMIRGEVAALLEGRPSPRALEDLSRSTAAMRRRGTGLLVKYALLVSALVVVIVSGLAVPLGLQMLSRERVILAGDLKARAGMLLDSAAARAASALGIRAGSGDSAAEVRRRVDEAVASVENITSSISLLPDEALFMTITGPQDLSNQPAATAGGLKRRDFLWATNDPLLPAGTFSPARDALDDADLTAERIVRIVDDLDGEASEVLAPLLADNARLAAESDRLVGPANSPDATPRQVADYNAARDAELKALADGQAAILALAGQPGRSGSYPEVNPDSIAKAYLFYRPIVAFVQDGDFTLGMVLLSMSTVNVRAKISAARDDLLATIGIVAIVAIVIGIVGGIGLAWIVVRPVTALVAHVKKIRDTEDITQLKEEIDVGTHDEIGTLAETVNAMTRGLKKAEEDKKELRVGKEVQMRFLPPDERTGGKGSTRSLKKPSIDIYGYYEGAKGVSGDYFDFQELDPRHYAIISCDVSGKGVPAAMIMVEVATLFLGWCNDQRRGRPGQHDGESRGRVDRLVALINDMLEDKERGFKGLFAALTIGIFETDTGALEVCSAGRNILHVWEADSRRVREYEIPTAPPAGTFSSFGVAARDLKTARFRLAPGDAAFLYTDGLDESKRFFRNYAGDIVACREPPPKTADRNPHFETHESGDTYEEFGKHRITKLLEAVLSGEDMELVRQHLPLGENLVFDFAACTGTTEEAVLALVAAERVFRTYRDPFTDAAFRIGIEPKIAGFLERHLRQCGDLFGHRKDGARPEDPVEFTHLKENPQYDDLALVVVRRPPREDGNR